MVELVYKTGGKTDLVAVGGITGGCGGGELPLRQLTGQCVREGHRGIACAGDTHGLIDIATAGKGIPDGAAHAGGGTAEGFNLRGMVVGLVLEHQEPVLILTVHICVNVNGAGIDFLGLVQILEDAALFQGFGSQGAHVHEGDGAGLGLFTVDLLTALKIELVGLSYLFVLNVRLIDVGGEGGVAAMVRPVGVHHLQLGDGGIPMGLVLKVVLEEAQIIHIHGKTILVNERCKTLTVQGGKALQRGNLSGNLIGLLQTLRLLEAGLPALHGVDYIVPDLLKLFRGDGTIEGVDLGSRDQRTLTAGKDTNTLGTGIGPLVILTGQRFYGKYGTISQLRHGLVITVVYHGL